jgi:hypothetical protein
VSSAPWSRSATPAFFARDAVVDERDHTVSVPVLLGGPTGQRSDSTVTVRDATQDGTALAGADDTTVTGKLTFGPGETVKNVVIDITDDADAEASERFELRHQPSVDHGHDHRRRLSRQWFVKSDVSGPVLRSRGAGPHLFSSSSPAKVRTPVDQSTRVSCPMMRTSTPRSPNDQV